MYTKEKRPVTGGHGQGAARRIMAIVLAGMLLVFGAQPAVAAPGTATEKADALKSAGLFAGTTSGYDLAGRLTREQGLTLALRVQGLDADVKKLSAAQVQAVMADVSDAALIAGWAKPYVAFALRQNPAITSGVSGSGGKVVFSASQPMSGKQFLVFLARAMGYQADMDNISTIAPASGMLTADETRSVSAVSAMNREQAVGVMFAAVVDGKPNHETGTVLARLVREGIVSASAARTLGYAGEASPPRLEVTGVTVLNTKQIAVSFNHAPSRQSVVPANFDVREGGALAREIQTELMADNTTVLLTLAGDTAMINGTTVDVSVWRSMKDASGLPMKADFLRSALPVRDDRAPVPVSVNAIGKRAIRVVFDEPVWSGTGATLPPACCKVTLDGATLKVVSAKARFAQRDLILFLETELGPGNVTVLLNPDPGLSGAMRDFTNRQLPQQALSVSYVPDTSPVQAGISSVDRAGRIVTVRFNKPVYGTSVRLYQGTQPLADSGSGAVTKSETAAEETWEFVMPTAISTGAVSFLLANSGQDTYQLSDLYGNKVSDAVLSYAMNEDKQAPAVIALESRGTGGFDILFDEPVDVSSAERLANYVIKDPAGAAVPITNALLLADGQTVRIVAGLVSDTNYDVRVGGLKDGFGNTLSDWTGTCAALETTCPNVREAYSFTSLHEIHLVFDEAMNVADLANKANYAVAADGSAGAFRGLGTEDAVAVLDASHVRVTIGSGFSMPALRLSGIHDLAGNPLGSASSAFYTGQGGSLLHIGERMVMLRKAELVGYDRIRLTFNDALAVFDPASILFRQSSDGAAFEKGLSVTAVLAETVNASGESEVTVQTGGRLNPDASWNDNLPSEPVEIQTISAGTRTAGGTGLSNRSHAGAIRLEDSFGGGIAKNADGSSAIKWRDMNQDGQMDTISILFEEPPKKETLTLSTFSVPGYRIQGATLDNDGLVSATYAGDGADGARYVILNVGRTTATVGSGTNPAVVQALPLLDLAGNRMN